jgi:hypothetical protein
MRREIKEDEEIKKEKKQTLYQVTNIKNSPFEFHIFNEFFRLEPRGKVKDTVILEFKQVDSQDFKDCCLNRVNIKEI